MQLSGHLLATPPDSGNFSSSIRGYSLPWYRGELLDLAGDLGRRLLPAFETPTGMPFARINLRHGLRGKGGKAESGETCSAGQSDNPRDSVEHESRTHRERNLQVPVRSFSSLSPCRASSATQSLRRSPAGPSLPFGIVNLTSDSSVIRSMSGPVCGYMAWQGLVQASTRSTSRSRLDLARSAKCAETTSLAGTPPRRTF